MRYVPLPHQIRLERAILRGECLAGAVDMGLGKTVVTLTAFDLLRSGLDVRAMLVVAPIRVCESVWPEEVKKWDHLQHLKCSIIRGSPVSRQLQRKGKAFDTLPSLKALKALAYKADVYLVNYEILPQLCEWMAQQKELPFDMLVFDESTKIKSASSQRFKAIKKQLHRFKQVVTLTGTNAPQSYVDLWSQYFVLDRGQRLGEFITYYKDRYFDYNPYSHETRLKDGADVKIQRQIRDITICMQSADYIKLPPQIENTVYVELPTRVRELYDTFERDMIATIAKGESIEAMSAAAVSMKCRQLTSGAVYKTNDTGERSNVWLEIHQLKLDALADIIDDAGSESVLVVYEFRHEIARLLKRWPGTPWIGGGSNGAAQAITNWNARKARRMFVHPASVGHGINLQAGGHIMVWTSGTWSYELKAQMLKRLHRQGQTRPCISHSIVARGTVDEVVMTSNMAKHTSQDELLRALKQHTHK